MLFQKALAANCSIKTKDALINQLPIIVSWYLVIGDWLVVSKKGQSNMKLDSLLSTLSPFLSLDYGGLIDNE